MTRHFIYKMWMMINVSLSRRVVKRVKLGNICERTLHLKSYKPKASLVRYENPTAGHGFWV